MTYRNRPYEQWRPAWQSGSGSLREGTRLFPTTEARLAKKCALCGLLLDRPCPAFAYPGHRNERVGERCAYGATNERDAGLSLRHLSPSLVSSLEECAPDVDDAYTDQDQRDPSPTSPAF